MEGRGNTGRRPRYCAPERMTDLELVDELISTRQRFDALLAEAKARVERRGRISDVLGDTEAQMKASNGVSRAVIERILNITQGKVEGKVER